MPKVLISGGSGVIGKALTAKLLAKGYEVSILSRVKKEIPSIKVYSWDIQKNEIEKGAIENADIIIHLAGENIGEKRWTPKRRKILLDSRVNSTQLIFEKVKALNPGLKAFISASATGYYGAVTTEHTFSEEDAAAGDFLGSICKQWEEAAEQFTTLGIRTVKIRTGIVLTDQGGALHKMVLPVKWGIGSPLSSGKQYMPWIHIEDLCNIYLNAIEKIQMSGAYNAVAPEMLNNFVFTKTLAKAMHKPFFFPNIPSFMLKLLFGNMSVILLEGSKVSPRKLLDSGFEFQFPVLEDAFKSFMFTKEGSQ